MKGDGGETDCAPIQTSCLTTHDGPGGSLYGGSLYGGSRYKPEAGSGTRLTNGLWGPLGYEKLGIGGVDVMAAGSRLGGNGVSEAGG